MQLTYLGINRIDGFKKQGGEPFSMAILYATVPIETGRFGKNHDKQTVISGFGDKPAELEADLDCLHAFKDCPKYQTVDLIIDQRFMFGEFKPVVTGWKPVPAKPASASNGK